MSVLAHAVPGEETFVDHLLHPFTGLDHLAAMALVAIAGVLVLLALRGHLAATTARTTTRVRSTSLVIGAATAVVLAFALLLTL